MSIDEILAPHHLSGQDFLDALIGLLGDAPGPGSSHLPTHDQTFLALHSGVKVTEKDPQSTGRSWTLAVESDLAELVRDSLTVARVATQLGIDVSRVRHRVRDGALYAFRVGRQLRLPAWQFVGSESLPGLRAILGVLPGSLHPLEIDGFIKTPDPDLVVKEEPVSPRQWLLGGGKPDAVVALARDLDRW
ncbi:MAG: helix-turn-helix domain-containing protein [Acidimicrobiales bacterium]